MDIKPGYMLGAKPRQQAIGHVIGIVAGALAATPLFFVLFGLNQFDPAAGRPWRTPWSATSSRFPAALQWKGVSDLVDGRLRRPRGRQRCSPRSIVWSIAIAGFAALVMEVLRIRTQNRFPLSPLAIGLGVVVPPDSSLMMFCGAAFFWYAARRLGSQPGTRAHAIWVDSQEPICAGLIAGAALVGIGDILVKVFVLSEREQRRGTRGRPPARRRSLEVRVVAKIVEHHHVGFRHQLAIAFGKVPARDRVERAAQQPPRHRRLDQRTHPARPLRAPLLHVIDQPRERLASVVPHDSAQRSRRSCSDGGCGRRCAHRAREPP